MPEFLDQITLEELEADPYPVYERLRKEAPVAWIPAADVWFVTRFDDCAAVGRGDLGFAGATAHPTLQRVFGEPNVLTSGGEVHADLRKGIDPSLQPRSVNAMVDDLVRPIARRYLAGIADRGEAELMSEFFEPVSVDALRSVMGLDGVVDSDTLRRWFRDLNEGASNFSRDPEGFAASDRASAEIESVVRPLLEDLRRDPDDSMLSHMLWAGREDGEPRGVELIMPSLKVILLGGMQEPGHAAGSTLHGLFGEPEQWHRLVDAPSEFIPLAVHEGMRWIAPIGAVERQATRDVEINGQRIAAGSIVQVILGSANRDEARFSDPDRFDMERATRVNQAFGNGEHFCAGHFFARQVQHIMFEELVSTLPELAPHPTTSPHVTGWVFRAPKVLPVTWNATDRAQSPIEAAPVTTLTVQVAAMRQEAEDIVSVELVDPAGLPLPAWEPGAHIDIWPTQERAGQYSLCGDPKDAGRYRIAVLREPRSRGVSDFVHTRMRVGDLLTIGHPRNHFPFDATGSVTFVAGGIGVTPLLPMMRQARAAGADVAFAYCGRTRGHLAFADELSEIGTALRWHVTEEDTRLDVEEITQQSARRGAAMYACGPQRLLDALEEAAERHGVPITVERFTGGEAHAESDRDFAMVLARSGRTLTVPASATAMEVMEQNGIEVRFACREGNCGSCETGVLSGAVDHRDVILTSAQRARNDRMMVCVSRAADDEIVLDV